MGRRALRKPDPELDLSSYLYDLDVVPKPFCPAEFFGRTAPFQIEVGSGKGLFLQNAAEGQPDHNFLGIEIAQKYAKYCAARLARRSLTNAKMIAGDAGKFFAEWLPDAVAFAVHVYFPDPWWKKRHKKRRVLNETFLRQIERVLTPGGELHFWSDVEEYFQTTLELIASSTSLRGPMAVPEREAAHDLDFRTHFERRFRLGSQPVYRSLFVRGNHGSACE
jgi:tRNA (guanine-N7-)-methyltransferase